MADRLGDGGGGMIDGRGRVILAAGAIALLALGMVLGSGPLRSALLGDLGDSLDALHEQLDQAEDARDAANAQRDAALAFIDGVAPAVVGGLLPGASVVIIAADVSPATADAVAAVTDRVAQAGGTVTGEVTVGADWAHPDSAPFRDALAEQVAPSLVGRDPVTLTGGDTTLILSHAFIQAATGLAPTGTNPLEIDAAGADRSAVLFSLLNQAGLIAGEPGLVADAVVLVGTQAAGAEVARALSEALIEYPAPGIVAGKPVVVDFVAGMAPVSTVTVSTWGEGSMVVVAAVAEARAGTVIHYSPGEVPGILRASGDATGTDG